MMPRPLDYMIDNLKPADYHQLRRYAQFSNAWGAFTHFEQLSPAAKRNRPEYWRRGLRLIDKALAVIPDYPMALEKRKQYQRRLKDGETEK